MLMMTARLHDNDNNDNNENIHNNANNNNNNENTTNSEKRHREGEIRLKTNEASILLRHRYDAS